VVSSESLAGFDLFQSLPQDALGAIAAMCQEQTFPARTVFFALDRPAEYVYVLQAGRIGLTIQPLPTRPPLTVSVLDQPGQLFGWSSIVGPRNYTATAQAMSDVRVITLDGPALMDYLERNPTVGVVVLKRLAQLISLRMSELRRLLTETIRDYEHPPEAQREN
jgi:CRP-like cAMP-binding protein